MRRIAVCLLAFCALATPAFGDDIAKKRQIDSNIASLQGKLSSAYKSKSSCDLLFVAAYLAK